MDRKTIVKRFLESGILLSPEALAELSRSYSEEQLKQAVDSGKLVITRLEPKQKTPGGGKARHAETRGEGPGQTVPEKQPQGAQLAQEKPAGESMRVSFRKPEKRDILTPQDFVDFYNHRYSAIRDMLLKRMPNAVSLNKVSGLYSDVEAIGMVTLPSPRGFILEDPTGMIEVVSKEAMQEDGVIGIRGFVKEGKLFPKEIVLPDVPLNRTIQTMDGATLLLSPVQAGTPNPDTAVVDGSALESNPAAGTVSNGRASLNILVYRPGETAGIKDAVGWLKARHMPHQNISGPEDNHIIDPVPDILWVISGDRKTELYKGVTIICSGKTPARVDLGNLRVTFG